MVTKTVAAPPVAFPEAPPRGDAQNSRQLYMPALPSALRVHLQRIEDRKPPDQKRSVYVDTNSKRSSDACKGEPRARKAVFFQNLTPCAKLKPSP